MKKTVAIAVALSLMVGTTLAGCGSDESTDVEETTQTTEAVTETTEESSDSSFEEFKKTMDDYEDFMNSYCDLMEEYNSDPAGVMDEYLEMNQKYITVMEELDAIDEDELTDEELAYYLEVMNRINARLLEVAN